MQGKDFKKCKDFANTIDRFIEILNRGDMKTQTHRQVEQAGPRLAQNVLKIMNVKMEPIHVQKIHIVLIPMLVTIVTAMMVTILVTIFVII